MSLQISNDYTRPGCHVRNVGCTCTPDLGKGWYHAVIVEDDDEFTAEPKRYGFRCNNCNRIQFYTPRQKRTNSEPTPAQQDRIARIERYFKKEAYPAGSDLRQFEVKPSGYDNSFYVVVNTHSNPWLNRGGHFHIGNHGKLEVVGVYDIATEAKYEESTAKHYAFMLGGKVGKICKESIARSYARERAKSASQGTETTAEG